MDPEVQAIYDEIMNAPAEGPFHFVSLGHQRRKPQPKPPPPAKPPKPYGSWHPTEAQLRRAARRLPSLVRVGGLFECWEFMGRRSKSGHGTISVGPRSIGAHRVAYLLWRGFFDPNLVIRHRCDNPPCCNPAHLVPGTIQQNVDDMIERGRAAFQRPGWAPPVRLGMKRKKK